MLIENTIIQKIAINAKMRWDNLTLDQARDEVLKKHSGRDISDSITYGSEMSSIEAIQKMCNLTNEQKEKLIEDVYTKNQISSDLAEKIRINMGESIEKNILEILSQIHDNWVQNNGSKFQARKKDYQFVDLKLLPFNEVESDLIFLQPILEAVGIEINLLKLKETFFSMQNEYMLKNNITSHENLVDFLKRGSSSYSALKGVKTNKKNDENEFVEIDELLKNNDIVEEMTKQIETNVACKTDLHTHINAILSNEKLAEMAFKLLGETIETETLEIQGENAIYNRMQDAYAERKKVIDELFKRGYGQEFMEAIAKELQDEGIFYAEITSDKDKLIAIQKGKIDIDKIEKKYGIKLGLLYGINRNDLNKLDIFLDKEIQEMFKNIKELKGIDIMRF